MKVYAIPISNLDFWELHIIRDSYQLQSQIQYVRKVALFEFYICLNCAIFVSICVTNRSLIT